MQIGSERKWPRRARRIVQMRRGQGVLQVAITDVVCAACICTAATDSWCPNAFPGAWTPPGFCAQTFAESLGKPRGMAIASNGDVLVVARPQGIYALWDTDGDGKALLRSERALLVDADDLNHGIAIHAGYLFASSDTTVYRWRYTAGQRTALATPPVKIVVNMNADGRGGAQRGHWTRTLVFDALGRLYVSVGSLGNVDRDSYRSRIRRFHANAVLDSTSLDFQSAEVFADGLRNEVGLAFNVSSYANASASASKQALFGVENGADNLNRADLGGDIHNDNPAEELNAFDLDAPGTHYGYPYCWTQYAPRLPVAAGADGGERGRQWAWPDMGKNDQFCRAKANNRPPLVAMQAHSAPLGITFFGAAPANFTPACGSLCHSFPCSWRGHAIVGFHGSWNRDVPTGYKVVHVPFAAGLPVPGADGKPQVLDLLRHNGSTAKWHGRNVRPVDVQFLPDGRLLVSDDGAGTIIVMSYHACNTTNGNKDVPIESSCSSCSPFKPTNNTVVTKRDSLVRNIVFSCAGGLLAMGLAYLAWSHVHGRQCNAQPMPKVIEQATPAAVSSAICDGAATEEVRV